MNSLLSTLLPERQRQSGPVCTRGAALGVGYLNWLEHSQDCEGIQAFRQCSDLLCTMHLFSLHASDYSFVLVLSQHCCYVGCGTSFIEGRAHGLDSKSASQCKAPAVFSSLTRT
jgi:hypothetical protein